MDRDIILIKDIPDDMQFSENMQTVIDCVKVDKWVCDIDTIKDFMNTLQYPLYFLDYETVNPWIPIYDWTKPYQQTTFQYSLHVQEAPGSRIKHYEYLGTWEVNPMPWLIESMKENIWPVGSVVVWNKWFETWRNKEMAEMYPEHSDFLLNINARVFDLMIPFRDCWYVIPEVLWSYSIKPILPILVPELSYKDLNIQWGSDASNAWLIWVIKDWRHNKDSQLYSDLLAYCELDTQAMVEIFKVIYNKLRI